MIIADTGITASKIKDNILLTDKFWGTIKNTEVMVYPQTTIKLNDKHANRLNSSNGAKKIKVSAVYNSEHFIVRLEWADSTHSIQSGKHSDLYPDAFAVQVPLSFKDPTKLPYIGMGNDGRPVMVHLYKAVKEHYEPNGNGDIKHQTVINQTNYYGKDIEAFKKKVKSLAKTKYTRSFISEGFRSMTEIKDGSSKFAMNMSYNSKSKTWSATIVRKFKDINIDLSKAGAIPIAFAVWDGSKLGRDGLKHLSNWISLNLDGKSGNEDLIAELTTEAKGDFKNGKMQVEAMCSSCHTLNKDKVATPFLAPDLSNIGGYSTKAYLAESISDPSAVVVPGYNRSAHKNFQWYTIDKKGVRASTMPVMMTDKKTIQDAVKYLKSLKMEMKK